MQKLKTVGAVHTIHLQNAKCTGKSPKVCFLCAKNKRENIKNERRKTKEGGKKAK